MPQPMSRGPLRWIDRSGTGLLSPALLVLLAVFVAPLLFLLPTSLHPYFPGTGIGHGLDLQQLRRRSSATGFT